MNTTCTQQRKEDDGNPHPLGILVAWIVLQAWVLPRFGVKT